MHPLAHAGPGPALAVVGAHHDALTDGPDQDVPLARYKPPPDSDSARESPRLYTACHGPARRRDLRRRGVRSREIAVGPLVPAARIVEVALEDVHDPMQPRCQRRLLLLDDLVRLLPVAGRQQLDRAREGIAHGVLLE